jgi:diguanylate cyclase (GGDEF)-like protein
MLAGGLDELKKVLQQGPALKPDAVCTLVIHVGFFWLGTIIATRLAEGMKARVDHAESVALLDPLTALPNRRGFMQKLRLEAERVSQWDWSIGMLVIDLDHFKLVNDRFDHKVGDLALVHAARILREVAGPLDHVCRLGGEEFAVATVGADRQHAEDLAQRIVREFRKHDWHVVAPGLNALTCSIGVTVRNPNDTPDRLVDFGAMIQDADHALLIRKRHGRNGYFVAGDKVPLKERENAVLRRPDHDGPLEKPRFIRR